MMEEYKFIPNNNKSVVRMLAKELGRYNKGRNRILMGAVGLCIVTLTVVFGIAFGKVKAETVRAVRLAGTSASACIEGAGAAQYEKVQSLSYVKLAGRSVSVGEGLAAESAAGDKLSGEERHVCWIRVVDESAWENILRPAYTDICGHYPFKKQQIMLPVQVLKELGISEPEAGMKIRLTVNIGLFRTEQEEFSLCGWYTDHTDEQMNSEIGYISEEKYGEWGYSLDRKADILICQSDGMRWQEAEKRLYEDVAGDSDVKITAGNTFLRDAVDTLAGSYELAVLGALVILSGMFFLIYNVMQISLAGDVRQMGLLNMLGTTKKQLRRIYLGQIINVLIPAVTAGTLVSVVILRTVVPEILGRQYLDRFGGAKEVQFFKPEILIAAVVFAVLLTISVSAAVISRAVNVSCAESAEYTAPVRKAETSGIRIKRKRRSESSELMYMAWQNLTRYRGRFAATVLSLFLGIVTFFGAVVITVRNDYTHVIKKRPDFLIAGEFGRLGQEMGYGNEYKSRNADEDPLETEGNNFDLLYGNEYDEFSPISEEVKEALLGLDGVKKKTSYAMEGAYMISTISRKGLRPLIDDFNEKTKVQEGTGYGEDYEMVESFTSDTIQILSRRELADLRKYVEEKNLPVDMDSLMDGTGVAVIHDHRLSPAQEKMAEESVGEPVYFTAQRTREEEILRSQMSPEERDRKEAEEEKNGRRKQRQSDTFVLSGYLDNRAEDFPHIRQTWHGSEGSVYYLISEKGFAKLPTKKKTLYMELDVEEEKEPKIKAKIQNILLQENEKRREMSGVWYDETKAGETGEAGIFVISRSDLLSEAKNYIRGSRIVLGGISVVLLFAGLTNFFNVFVTGILSRKKEFEVMESVGLTKRQKKKLLAMEGSYYVLAVTGLLLTVGIWLLKLLCLYMEA